jgi:hypothetical protein
MMGWGAENDYIDFKPSDWPSYFKDEQQRFGIFGYFLVGRQYKTNQFHFYFAK